MSDVQTRPAAPAPSPAMPRWRRDFRFVWGGESVSLFGTQILQLALPLTAITTLHASAGQLGLLGAMTYLPFLVFGLPAGVLVDRWRRRPVLIMANLGQSAGVGAVPILAAMHALTIPRLLLAAGVAGLFRVFFMIAYRSYLPAVVPADRLTYANTRLSASESAAQVAGPGVGGFIVQLLGAPYALTIDAISYLASALGNTAVRTREPPPERIRDRMRTQVAQGFRFTFTNPFLRAFAGEAASYNLFWQIILTILVLFAVRDLGLSAGTIGLVLSVGALGALLGAVSTERVARRVGLGRTLVAACVIGDIPPLVIPFVPHDRYAAPLLAVAFFVQGVGVTGCNVHAMAVRQTVTPDRLRGRTNAAYLFLVYGIVPVGALLGGLLGDRIGLRPTLLIGSVGLLGTSLFVIFSPIRHVRTLRDLTERSEAA